MPRLSQMKAKVRRAHVMWEDERVDFGYRPGELTPALMDEIQDKAADGDKDTVAALLEPILDWWDVLDDQDQRLPTNRDTIRQMPIAFLTSLMATMTSSEASPPAPAN